jgi:thiamine pyrophosphokinase
MSHEMANLNTILKYPKKHIILLSDENLSFFLQPGKHQIYCQPNIKVGLIPIGTKCRAITTSGLRWNLGE